MKSTFFAKYPNRKRGPGLKVNLEKLWSLSKLDNTVEIEGNKTLKVSIEASGRRIRKRLENKNTTKGKEIEENDSEQSSEVENSCMSEEEESLLDEISYKLNDEDANEFEQAVLSNTASPHILKNGFNFSTGFKRFQMKAYQEAKSSGLFINTNIHEILSLNHTVLLRKDQHDQTMSNTIGLDNIQEFHMELLNKYVNQDIKLEKNLFIELINIFRDVNEKSDRKAIKVKLHNVYETADPLDSKIIDILINLVNKLPGNCLIDEEVKEFELITNYLDMVLSPIFHDPQKKLMYRWLNKATESSGDRYPDGGSCIVNQRQIACSTGFCEVKADYMKKNTVSTHLDLFRLCTFGKDTIDNEAVENIVLLQAVGHRVIVYLCTQHDGGFYAVFEVDSIEVPKSILELPGFIMKLDDIKQLTNLYELFCVTKEDKTTFLKRKIPSSNNYEMNTIINTRKPKKMKTSLEF